MIARRAPCNVYLFIHRPQMDLYIYYRVPVANADVLQQQVARMQAQLAAHHRVAAALKRRPEATDGMHTWMEVYPSVPDAFEASLAQAVSDAGLDEWIAGVRHTEYFQDVSSCV